MVDLSPDFSLITPRLSMSSNTDPLMRRTSESTVHPPSRSLSTPSATSSIPSFRAIRNLLPFGPSKPSSAAQPSALTKHTLHFASLRRSSDRKASTSVRDHQREHDHLPVISITRLDSEEFGVHKRSHDLARAASASDSLLPSSTAVQSPPAVIHEEIYSPLFPCAADLSTILEADNSGFSKYIPSPSPSPPPILPQTFFPSKDTFIPRMFSSPPSQGTSLSSDDSPKDTFPPTLYSQTSGDPSPDTSNLDLSLSKISAELHDTLSPTTTDGWLSAVVVEDADMQPPPLSDDGFNGRDTTAGLPQASDPDATFDFSALDPDLAELLSPHRESNKGKGKLAIQGASGNSDPNGLMPNGVWGLESPSTPSSCLQPLSLVRRSTTPLSLGSPSIDLPPSDLSARIPTSLPPDVPTPGSRSPRGAVRAPEPTSASISRPSPTVRHPPSHLPRLMRSITSTLPSTLASTLGTYADTGTRMQNPPSPLSTGLVSADSTVRLSLDTTRMRKSSDKNTPRPSTDTGMRNARVVSVEQKQRPINQGHVSSPSGNCIPTGRVTPAVPCITTTLVPSSSALASGTCSNISTSSPSATTTSPNPTTPMYTPTTTTPHDPAHLRRRRHPHLFLGRRRSLSVDEPSSLPAHAARPGSSASRLNGPVRFGSGVRNGDQPLGARHTEDDETQAAGSRTNLHPGENRLACSPLTRGTVSPLTRGPGPPAMEWLGPRTIKAFAAAGLFDGERGGSGTRFCRDRAGSVSRLEHEHKREGVSSVLSWHDREREGTMNRDHESSVGHYDRDYDHMTSTIHRYASLRDHAPSRAAFSEAASTSSLGTRSACTAGNNGAGWSPRTAFSGSTAPTSVSSGVGSGGVGNAIGVNGTTSNGAFRILQEKHSLETSALLGALADSQETCRKLKEENAVLRERLRELEAMMNQDRDDAHLGRDESDEEDAIGKAHSGDQEFDSFPRQQLTSLRVSPTYQTRTLTPVPCRSFVERSHANLHIKRQGISAKTSFDLTFQRSPSPSQFTEPRDPSLQKRQPQPSSPLSILPPPSPQKRQIQKQRRASTTSSLFPAPPPEMSMLMLEDVGLCESPPSPGVSSFTSGKKLGHKHSYSHSMVHSFHVTQSSHASQSGIASTGIMTSSPSTTTFSMMEVPGSPHSLQLRPEHELHLGDMTSLSLYAMSDGDGEDGVEVDGWKDGI